MPPGSPKNLALSAYFPRRNGDVEKAQQLELQRQGLLAPQGTPMAAIAPEAQQMAAQAGGGPPMGASGVETGVRSSIAATVQGAQGMGPTVADSRVAGQMGIRVPTPSPNGGP